MKLEQPEADEHYRRQRRRDADPGRPDCEQDQGDDDRGDPAGVRSECTAEMEADRRLDTRRHSAQRAGDAGEPAEWALEAGVAGKGRQHRSCRKHDRPGRSQIVRIEGQGPA
jgi:hypothetical protein